MFVLIRGCLNIPKRRCWGGGGWTCQMAGTYSFVVVTTTLSALTPPSTPPATTTSRHPATAEILLLRPAAAPPPPHPPPHNKKWRSQTAVRSRPFCLSDYLFAPPPQAALRAEEPAPNSFPPLGPQCVQRYQFCPCASPVLASGHVVLALPHIDTL